jgi:hypothetical protein
MNSVFITAARRARLRALEAAGIRGAGSKLIKGALNMSNPTVIIPRSLKMGDCVCVSAEEMNMSKTWMKVWPDKECGKEHKAGTDNATREDAADGAQGVVMAHISMKARGLRYHPYRTTARSCFISPHLIALASSHHT